MFKNRIGDLVVFFLVFLVTCFLIIGLQGCGGEMQEFIFYRIPSFAGGLSLKADQVAGSDGIAINQSIECINCDFRDGSSIQTRDGFSKQINNTYAKNIVGIYPFYVGATRHLMVMTWDGTDYILFDSTTSKNTGAASAMYFNPAVYNDTMFIPHAGNDDSEDYNLKYDGTDITQMGVSAPIQPLGASAGSVSEIICAFNNDATDVKLYSFDETESSLTLIAGQAGIGRVASSIIFDSELYFVVETGELYKFDGSGGFDLMAPSYGAAYIFEGPQCLAVFEGDLYAGTGLFGYLLKWNGSNAWTEAATFTPNLKPISTLVVWDDGGGQDLYCTTEFDARVYRWDGVSNWGLVSYISGITGWYSSVVYDDGGGDELYGVIWSGALLRVISTGTGLEVVAPQFAGSVPFTLLVYDDGSGDALYCGTLSGELFKWNDSDAWVSVAANIGEDYIMKLLDSSGLYCSTREGPSTGEGHIYKWNDSDAWVDQTPVNYAGEGLQTLDKLTTDGNLTGTYFYYYTYRNSVTGQESALSPISLEVEASTEQITLTAIAASTDSQVDKKRIYRTGGGLSTINYIAEINNSVTTFIDNVGDSSVGDNEEISGNSVLAAVRSFSMHHHQLFAGYNDDNKGFVYDSKFYQPESFPPLYVFKIGDDTDYIIATLPLEIDLIVYSRFHTYRLRYIGAGEGDILMEEIAAVGLLSDNTLASAIDSEGNPFHVFLGQSAKGRGIYVHSSGGIRLISRKIDPIFTGERSDVTAINWDYVDTCNSVFSNNKYYLAYPEGSSTTPDRVLVTDFSFQTAVFIKYSNLESLAMVYDIVTDQLLFGGTAKEVYRLNGTTDWISGAATGIAVTYQTAYFGDRSTYSQMKSLTFHANTEGDTLTVKIYVDFSLAATLTCSTDSMKRVELPVPNTVMGRLFSVRFEITSESKVKISPPLEVKVSPLNKY